MVGPNILKNDVPTLPDEWSWVPIGECFDFKNGLNKAKQFFGYGKPIINYMDVFEFSGIYASQIKGKVDVDANELRSFDVKKGDVLFTRTSETVNEVGISCTVLDDVSETVFSGFVLRGRPKNNKLNNLFKKYVFSSAFVRKQIISKATYTTRALTNGRVLSNILIPVPNSEKEQLAIAEALGDVDVFITSLEKLIEKKESIFSGLKRELFKRANESSDYEMVKLGRILSYEQPTKYIVQDSQLNTAGKVPVLTANKAFILGYTEEISGIKEDLPVIIFDDFTTDKKFVDFKFKVRSSAMKLLSTRSIENDAYYVFSAMEQIDFPVLDHKRYWISEYQYIQIPLPRSEEQKRVTSILLNFESEIKSLKSKLHKVQKIKLGMVQELLLGRMRLT